MGTILKVLGIVAATVVITIAALATIGFVKGGKQAREAGPSRAGAAARGPDRAAHALAPTARPGEGAPLTVHASTSGNSPAPNPERPAGRPTSDRSIAAFIGGLDDLEAQGKHADAAVVAFKEIPSLSWTGRIELIAWLKARVKDGRTPSMYWIARAYSYNGDGPEAAKWYAAAGLTGRIDAARLTDVSAASAMPAVETHFAEIKKALKDDVALRRTVFAWALEYEESLKDRKVAGWIAAHGMDAFRGVPPGVVGDENWLAKRDSIREAWGKMGSAE